MVAVRLRRRSDGRKVVLSVAWLAWETERPHLHAIPELPHTAGLGVTRKVPDNTPMITIDHCQYANTLFRQHF